MSISEKRQRLADLIALRDSGVLETVVDGMTTKFQSRADLDRTIFRMQVELGERKRKTGTRSVYMGHR